MPVEFLTLADCSIAYQRQVGDGAKPGIIFLSGFASDMEGGKAQFLSHYCAEHSLGFVRFDYRGCGQSPGQFADGTIGGWMQDSLAVFDRLTEGAQIIVGSSMGGWLGLRLAQARPERARAFIGIAAAPDFTETLVWEKLTKIQRESLLRDGEIYEEDAPPDHRYPMTPKLIEEGRQHLIMGSPFALPCPARLLQGMQDTQVPWHYAERIMRHVAQDDVRVTLIKNGDHRLSTPKDLDLLGQMIAEFI